MSIEARIRLTDNLRRELSAAIACQDVKWLRDIGVRAAEIDGLEAVRIYNATLSAEIKINGRISLLNKKKEAYYVA